MKYQIELADLDIWADDDVLEITSVFMKRPHPGDIIMVSAPNGSILIVVLEQGVELPIWFKHNWRVRIHCDEIDKLRGLLTYHVKEVIP